METLQITLFGHISVVHPDAPAPLKLPRSTQALLAYLLLQPHLVPREVLLDVFWVDHSPDRARSSLTTALWRLRQLLEPNDVRPGTYLVTTNSGEVGFNWSSGHWLDTEWFEQRIYPRLRKPIADLSDDDLREIEGVLDLYRGDLLEGMYEDWALRERERFRSLHLNCLTRLMEGYAARKDFEHSIALAQEILRRDPVREEIHRALMRLYVHNGQRTLAMRQYAQCRDILDHELGVPPLEETQLLYQQILASSHSDAREAVGQGGNQEIAKLVYELQLVKQGLVETARALERINKAINNLTTIDVAPAAFSGNPRR
jgi:DNA-binding SARP family transcriptional activator